MSVKQILLRRRGPLGKISLKNTNSEAGEGFLPLDCMAEARVKGSFFQTPVGMCGVERADMGTTGRGWTGADRGRYEFVMFIFVMLSLDRGR